MTKGIIVEIISILLILLFGYAAVSKLLNYKLFVSQINESPVFPSMSHVFAWLIPLVELATCAFLIVPKWKLKGLYASTFLMFGFTLYITYILTLSDKIPCSCGGILSQLNWNRHLIFNIIFIAISLLGILLTKNKRQILL